MDKVQATQNFATKALLRPTPLQKSHTFTTRDYNIHSSKQVFPFPVSRNLKKRSLVSSRTADKYFRCNFWHLQSEIQSWLVTERSD